MLKGYRKVNHIELIDMGLTLHPKDWGDGLTFAAIDEHGGLKSYAIDGIQFRQLLEVLGIEAQPYHYDAHDKKQGGQVRRWPNPDLLDFRIYEYPPSADTQNIKAVWAKVEAANLLEIIIVYTFSGPDNSLSDHAYQVTYSGNFSIHWDDELPLDDGGTE